MNALGDICMLYAGQVTHKNIDRVDIHYHAYNYIGICWFLIVRHVVDSFTWRNVLTPKGPSSVAKRGTKQIMICFVPCMFLHPVSTPCFYTLFLQGVETPNYTQHTAINHVIIVLEQSSLTRHTPFQLGFMRRSAIPMHIS